jgi:hypothetical protein
VQRGLLSIYICFTILLYNQFAFASTGNFFHAHSLGYSIGLGNVKLLNRHGDEGFVKNTEQIFSYSLIFGSINSKNKYGIGFGIDKWGAGLLFPITLNYAFLFKQTKTLPLLDFALGYSLGKKDSSSFDDKEKGSMYYKIKAGLIANPDKKVKIEIGLFYCGQAMRCAVVQSVNSYSTNNEAYSTWYKFIGLTVGLDF